jgi:hypothetical protein
VNSSIKFCFLIPRTPVKFRTSQRNLLWNFTVKSLLSQKSKEWKAIVIGPSEVVLSADKRFVFLEHDLMPKGQKIVKAIEYLNYQDTQPEYLIRLDDDDLISEEKLSDLEKEIEKWDCVTDEYHGFAELSLGKISLQKRAWFPNTVLHLYNHAVTKVDVEGKENFLIAHDHSKVWHKYYQDKKVIYSSKFSPVYLRILSPTSITSGKSLEYHAYLYSFGSWQYNLQQLKGFNNLSVLSKKYQDFTRNKVNLNCLILLKEKLKEIIINLKR